MASELGILSRVRPRLITTLRPVPPGTNGGVTPFGTLVSILGGGLIGFLVGLTLIIENIQCASGWKKILVDTCVWGLIGGGFGSLVSVLEYRWRRENMMRDYQLDSILGATLQQTRYSTTKKVIMQENSRREPSQVISGLPLLTNNQVNVMVHRPNLETERDLQVNVVSSVVCAWAVGWIGGKSDLAAMTS